MGHDIFISHIHEDKIAAQGLKTFIEAKFRDSAKEGLGKITVSPPPKIFLSSSELKLGDDFLAKIKSALMSSKIVIAVFSEASVLRPWVNFEAGGAWFSGDKTLIPVCIGGVDPAKLPKPYSNIQGTNLLDWAAPYYLIESLWKVMKPGSMTPIPFPLDDPDVQRLRADLGQWENEVASINEILRSAGVPNRE